MFDHVPEEALQLFPLVELGTGENPVELAADLVGREHRARVWPFDRWKHANSG
jgi:hypothetical protein